MQINNKIILIALFLIGFLIHFKSFQMVPYGDDWRFIYIYFTHEEVTANLGPFPGIFAYMAPYGPSALTIGFLYQIFGSNYYIYYLVPLIFKILTAFFIYLILKDISNNYKKDGFINFLPAVLFLVGTTGIQAIDWAFHINVYIALFIFVLGLYFQLRFYNLKGSRNLFLGLLLSLLAILSAPFRLSPLILAMVLFDFIMLIGNKNKNKELLLIILLKNIFFLVVIFTFFIIGLFGYEPASIYSPHPEPLTRFIKDFTSEPVLSVKGFLHWVGIAIVPSYPAGDPKSFIFGLFFIGVAITTFYIKKSRYIILFSSLMFIPLVSMWIVTVLRNTDSSDKYLPLPFLGLCFLVGVLAINMGKFRKLFVAIIIGLVLMHVYSTVKIYSYWISIGRGADFIVQAQKIIMNKFTSPIKELRIIYLDFDNAAVQQSVVFGLGYRVAVLSETKGLENFPILIDKEENLIKLIQEKSAREPVEKIIKNVFAFQYKDKKFSDITVSTQQNLTQKLKK